MIYHSKPSIYPLHPASLSPGDPATSLHVLTFRAVSAESRQDPQGRFSGTSGTLEASH